MNKYIVLTIVLSAVGTWAAPESIPLTGGNATVPIYVSNTATEKVLNIPPRLMWGWGDGLDGQGLHGYCGECSFQSVGIFIGNWVSQERVRYADGDEELLIGVNDDKAAVTLMYNYNQWDFMKKSTPQITGYIDWIRNHIDNGRAVIGGFFEMQPRGDADYDHIMPIIGYKTDSANRVVGVYHNDFYKNVTSFTNSSMIGLTRQQCRQSHEPSQPFQYCLPKEYDYGIVVNHNLDHDGELYRTILTISSWSEPDWGFEDKLHETPIPLTIGATVYGLTSGVQYAILRFDDPETVPDRDFINGGWIKKFTFTATGDGMTFPGFDTLMSDQAVFYRTVLDTA